MEEIVNRLTQASTWRGVIALVACIGIIINPDRVAELTAGALGLIGAINVVRST